jgi:hypothetical protein
MSFSAVARGLLLVPSRVIATCRSSVEITTTPWV